MQQGREHLVLEYAAPKRARGAARIAIASATVAALSVLLWQKSEPWEYRAIGLPLVFFGCLVGWRLYDRPWAKIAHGVVINVAVAAFMVARCVVELTAASAGRLPVTGWDYLKFGAWSIATTLLSTLLALWASPRVPRPAA
ncbi:MAG: hypothetical protein H0U59_05135 [Gemmatimonadaceae bacterium]|nr:hypothetical protein [Gemmatimonadaceae bacterium]